MIVLEKITKILKALSDENRIRIICLLKIKKDTCVCELREVIGLSQPTVSSHLKILENAGLVSYRKEGQWVNYYINQNLDVNTLNIINNIIDCLKNDKKIKEDCKKIFSTNRAEICKKI
ncbi:MAG: winged helix-turn-helix transcriptional regulator [Actinobacteria bacterium]|nr:winged helix-turn-helix transcriptional regulator [Actinomycetota bacterium]MBL7060465.1 winged helix-turn-helix transcriptional regulator [Actinomycetota bacterium]